jgi:hypothetical protein
MAIYGTYCDLATLKNSLPEMEASLDTRLLEALEDCSRWIDGWCSRHFYVLTATRTFSPVSSSRLLLPYDLLSITTLKSDEDSDYDYDNTWTTDDYHLLPSNDWPKWELRVKPNSSYSFPVGQDTVQIAGIWGHGDGFSAAPYIASGCTITVADATSITVTPSDQALLRVGQTILVGTEQMYITALADGDVGADSATVVRGVNGTAAAAQAGVAASICQYPRGVKRACLRLANRTYQLESAPFGVRGSAELGTIEMVARRDPDILDWLDPFKLRHIG